jgi:uncharacterized delta-60 repeat protein
MQILSDGSVVVVGQTSCNPCGADKNALLKLKPNGDIDNYFGLHGWVAWNMSASYSVNKVVQKPDGKISVLGTHYLASTYMKSIEVYQFNIDGAWDTGFGINGTSKIDTAGIGRGLVVQQDGKLIVATQKRYGGDSVAAGHWSNVKTDLLLSRLNSDGSLDQSFNSTGQRLYKFDGWRSPFSSMDMVIQPEGGLLLSGALKYVANFVGFVARINTGIQSFSGVESISRAEVKQLKVYPNPITSTATIEFPNYDGETYTLFMYDMIGNLVRLVDDITTDQYIFYKEGLAEGPYFLELRSNSETFKYKILVK